MKKDSAKPKNPATKATKGRAPAASPKSKTPVPEKPKARKAAPAAPLAEDAHKFEVARKTPARRKTSAPAGSGQSIDNLGELPRAYGSDTIFVVAQEPHWLFCYWDYKLTEKVAGKIHLRHVTAEDDVIEGETEIPHDSNNWYVPVKSSGAAYYVELGTYTRGGKWKPIERSGRVSTPRDYLSGLESAVFANLPFHLSFQQLVEKLKDEIQPGESLADVISRLQALGAAFGDRLSAGDRMALEALIGAQLGSLSSEELGRVLRESLDSRSASMLVGVPSSWTSSWGAAGEKLFSPEFLEILSQAGASWSQALLSSWSAAGPWPHLAESSWSSWARPAGAGWAGLSSFEAVTSWQAGASWSAQPFSTAPDRGFFMHVNAEVIFYGGTHPDAKVTIDGRPVPLRPDGTFHFHFVFPDKDYEIPITATSPDGVETRHAVLHFRRQTDKSAGVESTGQPPLGEPMGRR